jgi:hypothetical protein
VLDTDGITVDMTLELEAAATFDPFTAFEDYTSKSLAFYVGPGTNNVSRWTFPTARLAKQPEITESNGKWVVSLSYLADHTAANPVTLVKA